MGTRTETVSFLRDYADGVGGAYSSWYAGIAKDPSDRLFNGHNVDKEGGHWAHYPADNENIARQVEQDLINLGFDGGGGGGGTASKSVYVYLKTYSTDP